MNRRQRAANITLGILAILGALIIWAAPKTGFAVIVLIICFFFIVNGIREVFFFCTMARHMVGGKTVLYKGIIMLDLGIFTLTLTTVPHAYVMLYLIVILIFEGAIEIIRTMEAKKLGAQSWKLNLSHGIINIAIAIICILSISSVKTILLVYGIGLIYTGCMRIVRALRRTDIIYIQ